MRVAATPRYTGPVVRQILLALLAALTLGLAPFFPEPHVVGKLRWVAGGARGMGALDWFDLVLHGAPWLWLLWALGAALRARLVARGKGPRRDGG